MKYFYLLLICLFSCQSYPEEVKEALELAGENKEELIKVLEYCKEQGKQEFKAACFLISNMKYHKSKEEIFLANTYDDYFRKTDSIYNEIRIEINNENVSDYHTEKYDIFRHSRFEEYKKLTTPEITKNILTDLETIKADFLIDNITCAFNEWKKNPFLKDMDFETFKEFILPYRVTDESIHYKRSEIREMYRRNLYRESQQNIQSIIENYKIYTKICRWLNSYTKPNKHAGIYDLFLPKFSMDCHNMTNRSCNILRACGIPVVYEYTPQWLDRNRKHFWCTAPDSTGLLLPFTAPENNFLEDWQEHIKYAGKVYRKTFEANRETPYFLSNGYEYIPRELSSPLLSDQTFRYHQTVTLRIPLKNDTDNNIAYLCMFNRDKLTPVGWGYINKNEIIFNQVPVNCVFIPILYDNEGDYINISSPFMIQADDKISYISQPLTTNKIKKKCDLTLHENKLFYTKKKQVPEGLHYISFNNQADKTENLILLRKYPDKRNLKKLREQLIGSAIVGSHNPRRDFDTLYIFKNAPKPYLQEIELNTSNKYRYYRFQTKNRQPVNIAHIEFLASHSDKHICEEPSRLPVFDKYILSLPSKNKLYCIKGIPFKTGSNPEVAFDGNYETYVASTTLGIDFGEPIQITHIRFIPRNANNMIVQENRYKLLYYTLNGWKEHSIQQASYNFLEFKSVPSGGIYLLMNLDNGNEEFPFFYKNNQQCFINYPN